MRKGYCNKLFVAQIAYRSNRFLSAMQGIADVEKPRICMKKAVRGGTAYIYNK